MPKSDDLLALALDAHGGLEHWNAFTSLTAQVSIAGAIWDVKQQPGLLLDKSFEISTHDERVTITPFGGPDRRSAFMPDCLSIEDLTGVPKEQRDDPERLFVGQTQETPWDKFHVAYFASEALWTYLTLPFLYTYDGFDTEEIEEWHENGEVWRRLKVTFPDYIASHTREQITHFGPDGLMRRHDYTVDILGGARGANYTTNYRDFQGIKMPTTRRIYAYDDAMQKIPEPVLVSLDFGAIVLA
jgi:hypothetical protein